MNKFKKETFVSQRFDKKTNKWRFQVRIKDMNIDKSFTETKYGSARRAYDEAVRFKNECLANNSKVHKTNQTITIEELFQKSYDILPVREETKRKQYYYFAKHKFYPKKRLQDITKADIVSCLNEMITDYSDDTIKRIYNIWKRIFKTAIILEYINYDLTLGIIKPKSQKLAKPQRKVITDRSTLNKLEECIINSFGPTEARSVVMALELMWHTGLRPAECFALNKEDIQGGYINVNKELGSSMSGSGELLDANFNVIRACKTETSIRKIPISTELQKKLDMYDVAGDILFPDEHGKYFSVGTLGVRLKRFGIPFNMYQLRHTVATNLIMNTNIDDRTISEILGHKNLNMSIYYARSNDEEKKKALEQI